MSQTKVTDAMRNVTAVDATKISGAVPSASLTNVDLSKLEYNQALIAFKLAAASSLAKFQMVDQVIDDYIDDSGIDASASTNEYATGSGATRAFFGGTTGSAQTVDFSFTGSNTNWVVPAGVSTINFIAWGAGGGSGNTGPGGGGGGFIEGNVVVSGGETLNVRVGGAGSYNHSNPGSNIGSGGGGTGIYRVNTVLAIAGGGGGGANNVRGGYGGGTTGGSGVAGAGTAATGGTQVAGGTASPGGGNGSLNTGGASPSAAVIAAAVYNGGGQGTGDNATFSSGGGGGGYYGGGSGGTSGHWGGGAGGSSLTAGTNTQSTSYQAANDSHANYPVGYNAGDAGTPSISSKNGAAVIIYTSTTVVDITLQSQATTAEAAPTTADLVVLIEDGAGTATVNTDIKGYVSRNGSAFSTAVTFVDEGDWGTNKRILVARQVDISGITSGTSMKYKLTTHNQGVGSKETKIHATSLAWA